MKSTLLRRYIPYDFKQKLLSKVPVIGKQYRTFEILVHPYDQHIRRASERSVLLPLSDVLVLN